MNTWDDCGVAYDKQQMAELQPSILPIPIENDAQIPTLGQGTVTLEDKNGSNLILRDVYFTPEF